LNEQSQKEQDDPLGRRRRNERHWKKVEFSSLWVLVALKRMRMLKRKRERERKWVEWTQKDRFQHNGFL